MKKISIIILLLLLTRYSVESHEFKMAQFNIGATVKGISLTVAADYHDLFKSVEGTCPLEFQKDPEDAIRKYLNSSFQVWFNGKEGIYEISCVEYLNEYTYIYGEFREKTFEQVREISFFNSFLINEVPGHSNNVSIEINNNRRVFRLHKDRLMTTATY